LGELEATLERHLWEAHFHPEPGFAIVLEFPKDLLRHIGRNLFHEKLLCDSVGQLCSMKRR